MISAITNAWEEIITVSSLVGFLCFLLMQLQELHLMFTGIIFTILMVGKGDKQRVVPFGEFTAWTIIEYLAATDQACYCDTLIIKVSETLCGFEGITQATIKNMFRRLKARAGIPRLYPHLLRHTFATRYLENGGNIYTLQQILGHTSLEMVKKYLHLATTRIRADFPKFSPLDNIKKDPS